MKKTFFGLLFIVFCLIAVPSIYALTVNTRSFLLKEDGSTANLEQILLRTKSEWMQLLYSVSESHFSVVTVCAEPTNVRIKTIKTTEATFLWDDISGNSWEYFIQDAALPIPVASGSIANLKEVSINRLNTTGANLLPNSEYDFYVKSRCSGGVSTKWIGPLRFRTACLPSTLPFWEGFNAVSTTFDCWMIFDNNKDSNPKATSNYWKTTTTAFEGGRAMYFNGTGTSLVKHDDWLVGPTLVLDATKIYRLRYHYRTLAGEDLDNEFEVLASEKGTDPENFTTVIVPRQKYKNAGFIEERKFLSKLGGEVNIAWRVTGINRSQLYLDNVFVEEVINCAEPLNLGVTDIKENKVSLQWDDQFNMISWEYVVQDAGQGIPIANGIATATKKTVVDKDFAGKPLVPSATYEYYVRGNCGNGTYSIWSGPFLFKTSCAVFTLPFWDGFNSNLTADCWTVLNNNDDTNKWAKNTTSYEGGFSMYFSGSGAGKTHDDWLVTPRLKLDSNKMYRLRYHYKNVFAAVSTNEVAVLLSKSGVDINQFTTPIIARKKYETYGDWKEQRAFFAGFSGEAHIAWHLTTKETAYFNIDHVFVEEVTGCPEPLSLSIKDVKTNLVNISWSDDFKADTWEYFVQKSGQGIPKTTGIKTTTKDNQIDKQNNGVALEPNTAYEYFVRTVCGNGSFSIWNGPFTFYTSCAVFTLPYWEGFNSDSASKRCWTVVDGNKDANSPTDSNIWKTGTFKYEGDEGFFFYGNKGVHNDWLISPSFAMDGGTYVLKYHYKTNASGTLNTEFEVLLSQNGVAVDQFKQQLVSRKIYREGNYVEEVVFISGIKGEVNIGWHVVSEAVAYVYLDNILFKKVEHCPEPHYVKQVGKTTNSIDIEWKQSGGITDWEIYVTDFVQNAPSSPTTVIAVSGLPKATIPNLVAGKGYSIYVRAICSDKSSRSDWSTRLNTSTNIGANDDCSGAINIPVNKGLNCIQVANASFVNASLSTKRESNCEPSKAAKRDIWFEFTATATEHMLTLKDYYSVTDAALQTIYTSLYDLDCHMIQNVSLRCFGLTTAIQNEFLTNLTPGKKYYLRFATTTVDPDFVFNICLTTAEADPMEISPSGNKYTVEQLVKEVLIKSNCDLVSNIKFQAGNNTNINTLGYFNKRNSIFPFEEGIVLATGAVKHIPGPHTYKNLSDQRDKVPAWSGDADLNDVIEAIGGAGFGTNKYVSVLEFDFVPITDSIKFEYLFASQSYHKDCGAASCVDGGAIFAAWLTDIETGVGRNLALVPGTDLPIALSTIRNTEKSGANCESVNPEFYWKHYANNQDNVLEAPINFVGLTKPMSSEMVAVKSCKKYRIKLAIADFCGSPGHTSAVFFNAGSFNIGKIDLGKDLLVETGNAICSSEVKTLKSGIVASDCGQAKIEWYKDGVLIPNESKSNLEVSTGGDYKVVVEYPDLDCQSSGTIKVEMYPPISAVVSSPDAIVVCKNALTDLEVDLTQATSKMFSKTDSTAFTVSYYETFENAKTAESPIEVPQSYILGKKPKDMELYMRVVNVETGCFEVFILPIKTAVGSIPMKPDDVRICGSYTLPALKDNQSYYSESGGNGIAYQAADVLTAVSTTTMYILQDNGAGCYEETTYDITITATVTADVFENKELTCELFTLDTLTANNRYFTAAGGQGVELAEASVISKDQTIYVFAESDDGLCTDESSFTVTYKECPIQKGLSPNGDGLNDRFDLIPQGVSSLVVYNRYGAAVFEFLGDYTDQWFGQYSNGKPLPDGTYYYVVVSHGKIRTGWVQINR